MKKKRYENERLCNVCVRKSIVPGASDNINFTYCTLRCNVGFPRRRTRKGTRASNLLLGIKCKLESSELLNSETSNFGVRGSENLIISKLGSSEIE